MLLDATAVDILVLDQLNLLSRNATANQALNAQLRALKYFLHLLGLDTTGHSHGPHSKVVHVHAVSCG